MASTVNVGNTTTACTFNQWRITTNLVGDDVNEIARGNFTKANGNVTLSNGTLLLANTTGGTTLEVKANARIDNTLDTKNIKQDSNGFVYLESGDIKFLNANPAAIFTANINTKFDSVYVSFSNSTLGLINVNTRNVIVNTANTLFQNNNPDSIYTVQVAKTILSGNSVAVSNATSTAKFEVTPNTFFYADANVSQNVAVGGTLQTTGNVTLLSNVSISKNTTILQNATVSGSINVGTTLEVAGNANITANLTVTENLSAGNFSTANIDVTQNTSTGNLVIAQNTSTGNLVVAQNTTTDNVVVSTLANIATGNIITANILTLNVNTASAIANIKNASIETLNVVNQTATGTLNVATANLITAYIESLTLTNPIAGPAETDASAYRLRVNQTTRGDGSFGVRLGSAANGNAWITFDTASGNLWRVTANSTEGTYYSLITMQNVVATTSNTSTIYVAAANTVNSLNTLISTTSSTTNSTFDTINTTFATTNTAIGNRLTSVSGTSGRITSSGGTTPTIDLATAGAGAASYSSGISAITVDAYGRVTSVSGSAAYITTNGRAYPRRSDGNNIDFVYSGQSGQPTWLWGTNDGASMYVWNPSNFSVSYASSAGNSDTVDGYHASAFALLSGATFTGSIYAPAFFYSSDRKLKENIQTIDNALNTVANLRGVKYNFIADSEKRTQVGVIAQEIKQFLPEVVSTTEDGMHSVSYGNIVGVLIEAIKELKLELDSVKKELSDIKNG